MYKLLFFYMHTHCICVFFIARALILEGSVGVACQGRVQVFLFNVESVCVCVCVCVCLCLYISGRTF